MKRRQFGAAAGRDFIIDFLVLVYKKGAPFAKNRKINGYWTEGHLCREGPPVDPSAWQSDFHRVKGNAPFISIDLSDNEIDRGHSDRLMILINSRPTADVGTKVEVNDTEIFGDSKSLRAQLGNDGVFLTNDHVRLFGPNPFF